MDYQLFQKVLHHADDARLNERDPKTGFSAIHIICDVSRRFGDDQDKYYKQAALKLRALLQRNVNPNLLTHEGLTAFLLASASGFTEAFDILLEYGADISITAESGMSVVAAATTSGSLRSLEKLRQLSASVDWTQNFHLEATPRIRYSKGYLGPTGCSALHAAATLVSPVVLTYLAAQDELVSKLDHPTEHGFTPLHLAAMEGCEENVKFLLQNGANKDSITYKDRMSPLLLAAFYGNIKVVTILLQSEASLATTAFGQSLEQVAKSRGHIDVVNLITQARSKRAKDFESSSQLLKELQFAIERGDLEACAAYIKRGAQQLGQFGCGCTPLIFAISARRVDAVALLLKHDASTAGKACGISHALHNSPFETPAWLSVAHLAIQDEVFNSLLGDLLKKCLSHGDHWAWISPSLVHVAVQVNSGAIPIIVEHLNNHWEWYR